VKGVDPLQNAAWAIATYENMEIALICGNVFLIPARLLLEIDIRQLLPGAVLHNEAGFKFFD
jgi:hypothetical protein